MQCMAKMECASSTTRPALFLQLLDTAQPHSQFPAELEFTVSKGSAMI